MTDQPGYAITHLRELLSLAEEIITPSLGLDLTVPEDRASFSEQFTRAVEAANHWQGLLIASTQSYNEAVADDIEPDEGGVSEATMLQGMMYAMGKQSAQASLVVGAFNILHYELNLKMQGATYDPVEGLWDFGDDEEEAEE